MKISTIAKALAALSFAAAGASQAATIDFDMSTVSSEFSHTNLALMANVYHGDTYVEDGFKLTSFLQNPLPFGPSNISTLYAADTSNVVARAAASSLAFAASGGAKTTLSQVGGGAFNLVSIDLAELLRRGAQSGSVTFTGIKADASGPVSQTINFGSSWSTASFVGFTNLSSVTWNEALLPGRDFQVDNINVTAVPEPETYAMLAAGLGLLAFVSRRKPSA